MELHTIEICAGVGMLGEGLRAGLAHLGGTHRTVCYVEREAYAASCLVARMEEGSLDAAPVWSDLLTFDGAAWRGAVDCIAAGFPCQDLSIAGKRAGLDGSRSGLFFNIVDIADACCARYLFLENVAGIASATAAVMDEAEGSLDERAAARVLGELADRGWHAEWLTLSASDVGASHGRSRWFCWAWREMADTQRVQPEQYEGICARPGETQGARASSEFARCGGLLDNTGRVQWCAGYEQDRPAIATEGRYEAHDGAVDRGGDVADAQGERRGQRERIEWQGRAETESAGDSMGNPDQQRQQQPHDADCAQPRGNAWPGAGRSSVCMADTSNPRQQGTELGTARDSHRGGEESIWTS